MIDSILDDVKKAFKSGNMVSRLIIVNIAVFLLVIFVKIGFNGFSEEGSKTFEYILQLFCMSPDGWYILTHPWVILTNMFLHEQFLGHLFWNMVFLYWFGKILGDLMGDHHILPVYLLSGLFAALCYFLGANFLNFETGKYALGASGAICGIMVASAATSPNYGLNLLFIGRIALKYVVAFFLILYLTALSNNSNSGGQLAHLGGALFGWFYIYQLRSGGIDMSTPVNNVVGAFQGFFQNIYNTITGKKSKLRVEYKSPQGAKTKATKTRSSTIGSFRNKGNAQSDTHDLSHQEKLDAILDKISKKGMESLSAEEKEFLFNASKNKK